MICCYGCGGRRKVAPLGGIEKTCAICKGAGIIPENAYNSLDIQPINTHMKLISHADSIEFGNMNVIDQIKHKIRKKPGPKPKGFNV